MKKNFSKKKIVLFGLTFILVQSGTQWASAQPMSCLALFEVLSSPMNRNDVPQYGYNEPWYEATSSTGYKDLRQNPFYQLLVDSREHPFIQDTPFDKLRIETDNNNSQSREARIARLQRALNMLKYEITYDIESRGQYSPARIFQVAEMIYSFEIRTLKDKAAGGSFFFKDKMAQAELKFFTEAYDEVTSLALKAAKENDLKDLNLYAHILDNQGALEINLSQLTLRITSLISDLNHLNNEVYLFDKNSYSARVLALQETLTNVASRLSIEVQKAQSQQLRQQLVAFQNAILTSKQAAFDSNIKATLQKFNSDVIVKLIASLPKN